MRLLQQARSTRTRWRSLAAASLLVAVVTVAPGEPTTAAIGGTRVVLRSPFDGGGPVGTAPATHPHRVGSGFGMDLLKAPGATVYANFLSTGIVTFRTGTLLPSAAGAGTTVPVTVLVDGSPTGTVWFHHLTNVRVASNTDYPAGAPLGMLGTGTYGAPTCSDGTADGWPLSPTWTACSPTTVFTHLDVSNGCYASAAPGTMFAVTAPVLMLSNAYAADNNSVCDPLELATVNSGVEDGDEDGVPDHMDACISVRGFAAWRGCSPQLLTDASFERQSPIGWTAVDPVGGMAHLTWNFDQTGLLMQEGTGSATLSTSAPGGSVQQTMHLWPLPSQSYTFSIWMRSTTPGRMAQGSIVLRGTGGLAEESARQAFTVGPTWTVVAVTFDVRAWHTGLRAEVASDTVGVDIELDGAQVARSLLRNGSLEEGSTIGWKPLQSSTVLASYSNSTSAHDGKRYGAVNVAVAGGGVMQEVGQFTRAGDSHTFSVWLRTTAARPVSGVLRLSAAGTNPVLGTSEPFTVGSRWTLVSVTYDATQSRSFMRAQLLLSTTGRTVLFDGAQMVRNAVRNASFEEGATTAWRTANATGGTTTLTARQDPIAAKEGAWYGILRSTTESGSMYQDIALAPRPRQSLTLSIWVKRATPGKAHGVLALYERGGTTEVKRTQEFWANEDWTAVSVTLDIAVDATSLRAALVIYTPGITVHVDGAMLSAGANRTQPMVCSERVVTVDLGAGFTTTAGNDVVAGTPAADVIDAGAGNDIVCSGLGNDTILGGSGNDTLLGGDGNDSMNGGTGWDYCAGGTGVDRATSCESVRAVP